VTLLNATTNRWEIKGTPFYNYIQKLQNIYSQEIFQNILLQNYIDPQLIYAKASEEDILFNRAQTIAKMITNHFTSVNNIENEVI